MVDAVMAGATMEVAGELTMVVSGLGLITAAGAVNMLIRMMNCSLTLH